jgi:hypothetical protein
MTPSTSAFTNFDHLERHLIEVLVAQPFPDRPLGAIGAAGAEVQHEVEQRDPLIFGEHVHDRGADLGGDLARRILEIVVKPGVVHFLGHRHARHHIGRRYGRCRR